MVVRDIMSGKLITISPEENTAFAARLLYRYNIGALPVCTGDGRLRGMVTDRDIVLRCIAPGEEPEDTRVSHIMTRKVFTVGASDPIEKAADIMAKEKIRRLPVEEKGQLIGMVSLGDISRIKGCATEAGETLGEISENIRKLY